MHEGDNDQQTSNDYVSYTAKRAALFVSSIDKMMSHDFQRIFCSPVTDEIAPDYKTIIKTPMDLSTMKGKVHHYESIREIQQDLDLIISNSEVYNGKESPITQIGYDLRKQWLRILNQTEDQDKKLKLLYHVTDKPTVPTGPSPSEVARKALPLLLLITGIAFSTPAFYSQLLRAIYQRLFSLCFKDASPSSSGIVDPILYTYIQFLSLAKHVPDLVQSIRGKSDFFPTSFFDKDHKADLVNKYVDQHALFVWEVILYSRLKKDVSSVDEVFSILEDKDYRDLIYCCCASQVSRVNDMHPNSEEYQVEVFILSNFYKVLMRIPPSTLLSEWNWVNTIVAAQIVKRVKLVKGVYD